jgi:hypothetical protein
MTGRGLCSECTRPARGPVPADGEVPAHKCRQCAEHCKIAEYVRDQASEAAAAQALGVWP